MPEVQCAQCKTALEEDSNLSKKQRIPCPKCGSLSRSYHVTVTDEIRFHEKLGMKARHSEPGKPYFESVSGSDIHRQSGNWMKLERIIDRENDHYREVVTDPKTGKVIHYCEEPLSEHRGHGSAKKDKN